MYAMHAWKIRPYHNKISGGRDTNNFELLMLKHDQAYSAGELKESMCVIIKCNTVLPCMAF